MAMDIVMAMAISTPMTMAMGTAMALWFWLCSIAMVLWLHQGILKGEVLLYHCPPVWLVWIQLYDNRQFLFLFAKQTNPNQSNRRSMVQWHFPFSIPWLYLHSPWLYLRLTVLIFERGNGKGEKQGDQKFGKIYLFLKVAITAT